jgi:hypothetical protein
MAEYLFNENNTTSSLSRWMNLVGRIVAGSKLQVLFGATADGRIVHYDVEIGKKLSTIPGVSKGPVWQGRLNLYFMIRTYFLCVDCLFWWDSRSFQACNRIC